MAVETLQTIPDVVRSGDTIRFTQNFSGFAPATWTAKLLIGFDTPYQCTASTSGSSHLFEITALNSAGFAPGTWPWSVFMEDSGGERTFASQGTIRIMPNPSAVREPSAAENMLAELDAAMLELAGSVDLTVSYNGQSFTQANRDELFRMRIQLQAQVLREKEERLALAGGADGRAINVRFSNGQPTPYAP